MSLELIDGYRSKVALTDLHDDFIDNPTQQFRIGSIVQCYTISVNHEKKYCIVSLRKSRYVINRVSVIHILDINFSIKINLN